MTTTHEMMMMVADGNDTAEQDDELIQMRVVRNVLRYVTCVS